jgi:hypothetical protein
LQRLNATVDRAADELGAVRKSGTAHCARNILGDAVVAPRSIIPATPEPIERQRGLRHGL